MVYLLPTLLVGIALMVVGPVCATGHSDRCEQERDATAQSVSRWSPKAYRGGHRPP